MKQKTRLFLYRDPRGEQNYVIGDSPDLKVVKPYGEWSGNGILVELCPDAWHAIRPMLPRLPPGAGPREIELTITFKETSEGQTDTAVKRAALARLNCLT